MTVRVPRIVHFVFGLKRQPEPFHLAFYLTLESCRVVNAPERIIFHYRHEPWGPYWDLIRPHLTLRKVARPPAWLRKYSYADRYVQRFRYAHLADYIRLKVLYEEGGIYADMDTLFLRPWTDVLMSKSCVMGQEAALRDKRSGQDQPSLCNALIMAEKQAPFIGTWMNRLQAAFDGTWSNHSCQLPARLALEQPESIHIEPSSSFFPYMWSVEDLRNLWEDSAMERSVASYSLHMWNHLWWEKTRIDFSSFHAGLLNYDYVTQGPSSYAQLARRFLPPPELATAQDRAERHWRVRFHHWRLNPKNVIARINAPT